MGLMILAASFAAGFGAGAWRAGSDRRSLVGAAAVLPLAILLLTAIGALLIWAGAPRGGGDMSDLATISVATFGGAFAFLAFAGGLFGAWYRRAGSD